MSGGQIQFQTTEKTRLKDLHHLCHAVSDSKSTTPAISTHWGIDADLPHNGLSRGRVHEWFGGETTRPRGLWSPPLVLLADLACGALDAADNTQARLVWIGREVWPYAPTLASSPRSPRRSPLTSSLFLDAPSPAQRLWACDLALRSRAAVGVIANGAGFDLRATRRLQLAVEAGGGLCLLARPPWEQSILSASTTRWLVRPCPSPTLARRWTVSLLRCKGVQPRGNRLWTLERDHATRAFAVVPDLCDRSRQTPTDPLRLTG